MTMAMSQKMAKKQLARGSLAMSSTSTSSRGVVISQSR